MSDKERQTFCHCFGCDNPIYVGDYCHSITYSHEKIGSIMSVTPTYAEGLGTWCSECFNKMLSKGECSLSLEYVQSNTTGN
ncbi:hypothetical protein [Thalassotalea hakodatensis]|uniref:hypothetical protein n=1 Tax=Thalassotalea hakodatensis TaxID=3030492 RepID=UPI0025747CFD|nr:hypothetical protein [Thalassotalea hakodatensis]